MTFSNCLTNPPNNDPTKKNQGIILSKNFKFIKFQNVRPNPKQKDPQTKKLKLNTKAKYILLTDPCQR